MSCSASTEIDVQRSLYELGGDSTVALQLVHVVEARFGARLPMREILSGPPLFAIADRVKELIEESKDRGSDPGVETPPLTRTNRQRPIRLSFAQERLWFLWKLRPDEISYHMPAAYRLRGPIDVDAFSRALSELVRRHEVLRTALVDGREGPRQRIVEDVVVPLPVEQLIGTGDDGLEPAIAEHLRSFVSQPFVLSDPLKLRAKLLRLAPEDHVLLFVMHHVASDGWSIGVMMRELTELYAACVEKREARLPELAVQYADYAEWQRGWLRDAELDRQLEFWRAELEGAPPILELPTDRTRPKVKRDRGSEVKVELSADVGARIDQLAREEGATPFMVLLAAYGALLGIYARSEEVTIGTLVANRPGAELEGLIGFFTNTLALRVGTPAGATFRELVRGVKARTLGAYDHQDLPFERLVTDLNVERNTSVTPVFQVLFLLQNTPESAFELHGLEIEPTQVSVGASLFDLELSLTPSADGSYVGGLVYDVALFDRETVERMAEQFVRLVEVTTQSPEKSVAGVELVSAAEAPMLDAWTRAPAPTVRDLTLHEAFVRQRARAPLATAFVSATGERMTYADVDVASQQVAAGLRALGVAAETRVALLMPRTPEAVVAMLGASRLGASFVPVDPGLPTRRQRYLIEQSSAAVVVVDESVDGTRGEWGVPTLRLDEVRTRRSQADHADAVVLPSMEAYVIYTSGSTGRPKGVTVPQSAAATHNAAATTLFALGPTDRVAQTASLSFDASIEEIFPTLRAGGTVVFVSDEERTSAERMLAVVEREGITVLNFTTALWAMLTYELDKLGCGWPKSVRLVIVGGEEVKPEPLDVFRRRNACEWLNTYGPTETAITATAWRAGTSSGTRRLPIGRPIEGYRAYLLDDELRATPVGIPSDLYIGGAGVARGYVGAPGMTAERFWPDPFSRDGARMYKTGDIARWTSTGELEFLGRSDDQVKLRGFRVELGEVERTLESLEGVERAVCLLKDTPSGPILVAHVSPQMDTTALRTELMARLPSFMVPTAIASRAEWPVGATGKVDKKRLGLEDVLTRAVDEEPRTETERVVAELYTELLGVDRVRRADDFFALGGHSLLVVRLVNAIRAVLGVEVAITEVFAASSVSALSAVVDELTLAGLEDDPDALEALLDEQTGRESS